MLARAPEVQSLGSQVLRHLQLCPVVDALEFYFVHQGLNQLQSPAATALSIFLLIPGVNFLTILARKICRHNTTARNSNDQFITFNAKPLINLSIRTEAVLGGVDASFNQRGLNLIYRFRPEVHAPRD